VVALDHFETRTTAKAHAVLPTGTFAEADGTVINNEGRAQRFYQVFKPEGAVQESWRWLRELGTAAGRSEMEAWRSWDDLVETLGEDLPSFQRIREAAPVEDAAAGQKIPRQSHRYSGRTAVLSHVSVHEPKPPDDLDSPLAFSMEGNRGAPPSSLIPRFWAPGWNSVQALNKYQDEVGGPLRNERPGVRLLEPASVGSVSYFRDIPPLFRRSEREWLILPLFHIFGTEELSVESPGLAERIPSPFLALSPDDAARLQLAPGQQVRVTVSGRDCCLPMMLNARLAPGTAGWPLLPGLTPVLPAWGVLERVLADD
jgi:NADH-quinone oxidoreductase subunit G